MNFDDSFAKRRPVPVLTRENSDQWFTLMERWLMGEDLYYVVNTHVPTTPASNITSPLGSIGVGNQRENAKTLYWLTICISADDQEYISDKTDAKSAWDALKSKYKEKLQTTGRQYLQEFIGYKMAPGTSVDKA